MKKTISTIIAAAIIGAGSLGMAFSAYAQTTASMPALYDQSGTQVNSTASTLAAGYYYIGGGVSQGGHQVYYYGNGVFYDPTTQLYGGSIGDPSGMAGVALTYVAPTTVPSVPNTGAGGLAAYNWLVLIVSGVAFAASAVYVTRRTVTA